MCGLIGFPCYFSWKMSYIQNKIKRLRTKYANILMKDFEIRMTDSSTKVLVVCNGGLCNGITHEMVCDAFESFGEIENVVMVPGKSYSFIIFKSAISASEAYNKVNGEKLWPEIKGPVYLGFVQNINISLLVGSYNFSIPPGLILIENFITKEEEDFILKLVGFGCKEEGSSELKNRKVKHYGFEFKYSVNNVDLNEPIEKIPEELNFLWERLQQMKKDIDFKPDQLTINCYEPGQGIPPHVDTHSAFEDGIVSLSLESTVVMDFRDNNRNCNVVLPRRSLCLMFGESRYNWTHGIALRKSDVVMNSFGALTVQNRERRTSLTFRKTRTGECNCLFPKLCDSALKNSHNENIFDITSISLKNEVSSELEESYVHEVYDKIAAHFSETRQKPWPNVMKFVNSFERGSVLLDVGCGNGKYFTKQNERFELGCDSSIELLKLCKKQEFECLSCNCLSIPIRDEVADGCICIAVIHHLTTDERRKKAIKEIMRVLRSKGRALIYVWAKNQERKNEKSSYLKQCTRKERKEINDCSELKLVSLGSTQEKLVLPVHVNRTNFSHNDLLVPWKLKTNNSNSKAAPVHLRYYHVYEDNELKQMCQELENVEILDYYYDQGNWCIILQKK